MGRHMNLPLLDTCALLWWSFEPNKLSPDAYDSCGSICNEGGCISAISIWEIGLKIKKGSLDIKENLADYVHRLKKIRNVQIIPVDEIIWMQNLSLEWEHRDPADRTIVATAKLRNLPIITKDPLIRNFYPKTIW